MTRPPRDPASTGPLATLGGAALIVLCCAGPVLVASGALAGIGPALRDPWLIGLGAGVVPVAIVYSMARIGQRRRSDQHDACCPPPDQRRRW